MAKRAGKPYEDAERYWKAAKISAKDQGFEEGEDSFYAYVTGIVKRRLGLAELSPLGSRLIRSVEVAKLVEWDFLGRSDRPNRGEDTGWTDREINALQKTNVKLARMLSRTDARFRLYFVPTVPGLLSRSVSREGYVNERTARAIFKELHLPFVGKDDQAISVFFRGMGTGFERKENLPPTPWIVVHWLGHVILKVNELIDHTGAWHYGRLSRAVYQLVNAAYDTSEWGAAWMIDSSTATNRGSFIGKAFLWLAHTGLLEFRAARTGKIRNAAEAFHDMFAEWLTTGRIRTGKLAPYVKIDDAHDIATLRPISRAEQQMAVGNFALEAGRTFENALDMAKGNWYVI